MNKVLCVLIIAFLALAGAGLFFEIQLNAKRSELCDRNRLQEDYLVKIAKTIEKAEPDKSAAFEIKKDTSAVEAKLVDAPDMENVLEEYPAKLEQANLETYNLDNFNTRQQLRTVYVLDSEGKPVMDGAEPLKRGPGTEDELLSKLFESAKNQQAALNTTRAALTELRGKLESAVTELNKLKPEARQDKVAIEEQKAKIAKLETEKNDIANQVAKHKAQNEELNAEISSLKDEVQAAKDETEAAKEDVAKSQKLIDQLKKLLQESIQTSSNKSTAGVDLATVTAGDKGKIVDVDNENMFAIVAFSDEAMKELKGGNAERQGISKLELGIRRPGFKGEAGEFVGRIRLRQEVKGKNYVVCDLLGEWEQAKVAKGDVIFAD